MPEVLLSAPPTGPGDPHTNPGRHVEYSALHDESGAVCGVMVKGKAPGWVMEELCNREGIAYDPDATKQGMVRWVPARPEEALKQWLKPVGPHADTRGAFIATHIDTRYAS